MGRKPIDRESLRKLVIDALERSIQTRGLGATSMSDLVRASGVSRRTFYKVFRSKDEVIKGMVDRKVEGVVEIATSKIDEDASTAEKLESLLDLGQKMTSFITPEMMREVYTSHPHLWEYIDRRRMKVLEVWRRLFEEGQKRGEIRRDVDIEIFMLMLTTIAQNMINPRFLTEHELTPSQVIGQARAVFLHGLLPREEATP